MSQILNPPPAVTRVLRASMSRVNGSVMSELFAAREKACGPNRIEGLCSALLYSSGWFVLWLEGSAEAVDRVLTRSARHACHARPRIVHRSVGPATLSEPMNLLTTQGPETAADLARRLDVLCGSGLEPGEIWRLLSEPSTLDAAAQVPVLRRIALVAADDNHSIDIVRKLAERFRRPMVYQRFAGAELNTSDVGAAYVDIPSPPGRPTRIQVLSRRALGQNLVRRSLAGIQSLAVLMGERAKPAIELAASVAAFVDAAAPTARVGLVGPCPIVAATVGEYLRERLPGAMPNRILQVPESLLVDLLVGQPA
jgi:hypothetical protein